MESNKVVMLDTVVLQIPPNKYKITDHNRFKPPAWGLLDPRSFRQFFNNRTAEEKRKGIYRPRLTINKRGRYAPMNVEFSAPKIIFNENVSELVESNFTDEIYELWDDVRQMGVLIPREYLAEASVIAFHPSRNVLLTDGYTSSFALKELSKIDLDYRFDLDIKNYRNGGHVLQYYSNLHSLLFYDKVRDDRLPEKRAIDKDKTSYQMKLFESLPRDTYLEILKIEVRLKKRKIAQLLPTLGYSVNPSFRDIFNSNLCQKILQHYWRGMVVDRNALLMSLHSNPQRILQKIIKSDRKIKPKQAIYLTALKMLCKDVGVRELRSTLSFIGSGKTWERIHSDIKLLNTYESKLELHGFINDIERALESTEPFKLSTTNVNKSKV